MNRELYTSYTTDGYERIAIAIVKQAADDYAAALCGKDDMNIKSLERFFLSDWGQALSYGNGLEIIKRIKRQAAEKAQAAPRQMKADGKAKPVVVYEENGNFVGEFHSLSTASVALNISPGSISNCCRGLCQSVRGYIFKYKKGQ